MNNIIEYFGDRLVKPALSEEVLKILPKISLTNQKILLEVGLPERHDGYAGVYTILDQLSLHKSKYIKLYTRELLEDYFSIFLDVESDRIIYHFDYEGSEKQYLLLNSSLLVFLEFWKAYEIFSEKIDLLGMKEYYGNKKIYSTELRSEFEKINKDDTNTSWWGSLLEEMESGPL
ncbi:MAG: hypothetical protein F9K23_14190 [Bacteroidetes bacterium]|nr:MAG: hypothetical protein F9K23_14190 [Bacteroidota bacterium]